MATATHDKFCKHRGGTFKMVPVAASEALKRYDIVSIASGAVSQSIALPGTDNTATASGGNLPIYGIVNEDFTADAAGVSTDGQSRTEVGVWILDDKTEYLARIYHATASSSQQQDVTIGTAYQFQRWRGATAGDWWYEWITTTTNGEFIMTERSDESAPTDSYGLMWAKPILSATVRQGG